MKGTILLLDQDGTAHQMNETEYVSESELQRLLARYCDLLPGDQISPEDPRRWVFIGREVGIPGGEGESDWLSLDHLFLDQDGVPTFVECKRASDTRARREVVAQMLDYAANATAYWTVGRLHEVAAKNSDPRDGTLDTRIGTLIGSSSEEALDSYWKTVEENLRRRRVRLVFVLDEAPRELRRLTEFLNEQMTDTEVLLVEVKQFKASSNAHALVPRLIGRTERSAEVKRGPAMKMSLDEVFRKLETRSQDEFRAAKDFHDWCLAKHYAGLKTTIDMTQTGFVPRLQIAEHDYGPFRVKNDGKVVVEFRFLKRTPAFASEAAREELVARIHDMPGVTLDGEGIGGKRSFPLAALANPAAMTKFRSVVDWITESAVAAANRPGGAASPPAH